MDLKIAKTLAEKNGDVTKWASGSNGDVTPSFEYIFGLNQMFEFVCARP